MGEASSVHRVRTGFTILSADENTRERILGVAPKFSDFNAKLEEASNLVAFRIAKIPATTLTDDGIRTVDEDRISVEIYRKIRQFLIQVRPHGTCRPGAPYRNWHALFDRDSAPRAGFRLFDESGMATIHKPRRHIEQCKCCLGFHATRGCSRAPARWNRGSDMHSEAECMALTKCRNCGGPVTKEQLAWICEYGFDVAYG